MGDKNNLNQPKRGNTPGNITNAGLIAMQGDWVYFNGDAALYKKHLASGELIKLSDDNAWYINVLNDWIYYAASNQNYSLFRLSTNGKDRERLNTDNCEYVNVIGERIFYCNYSDHVKLYTMHIDGKEKKLVNRNSNDSSFYLNAFNDWIYYANDFGEPDSEEDIETEDEDYYDYRSIEQGIYKIKPDGSEIIQLNNDRPFYINVAGDWVYYANADDLYQICKIKIDGSERTELDGKVSTSLNVSGDWIYFNNHDDGARIYRIGLDGSNKTRLSEHRSRYLYVYDDWIFYYTLTQNGVYRMKTDGSALELFYK